ncbi:MAG: DUF1501 domain-containing protein [Planctomycetota bacterium]|nr:MAG: DUF1501 domain-containing protein [Planctomycetota bacterium]
MSNHRYCDGLSRRDVLRAGMIGATGLTLGQYFRLEARGAVRAAAKAKAAIFVNLNGGPSHQDTFDLKPEAPAEFRGEFKPIKTNVLGIEICEHLPRLAACADKYAILRGVSHNIAAHPLGQKYLNTGNRPVPSLEYPSYGSVVSKELPSEPTLPSFVAVPNTAHSAGFLGVRYNAFQTNAAPRPGQPFNVRGITLAGGVTVEDVQRRQRLLSDLDQTFAGYEKNSDLVDGLDQFSRRAYDMLTSREARDAFDVAKEPKKLAEAFGESAFGQSCLLASRLVQSGVRFVTVTFGGWDTHNANFTKLKDQNLPQLDAGLSALFVSLAAKGLLDSTVVFVTGEFGRTPKVNGRGGRDHWARAMFCLLGGGGIKTGQVVGASDDRAAQPAGDAVAPEQVAATFYRALGIDFTKEYHTSSGRPITLVREGSVIPALLG